jgi:hypothetical protein
MFDACASVTVLPKFNSAMLCFSLLIELHLLR